MSRPIIAITKGDPAGIGPVAKLLYFHLPAFSAFREARACYA